MFHDWLGIPEKVEDQCTTLSGGQKRRLWVATALLGETPVVFLDEPTSGMDPSSRRQLWELLLQIRAAGLIFLGALSQGMEKMNLVMTGSTSYRTTSLKHAGTHCKMI